MRRKSGSLGGKGELGEEKAGQPSSSSNTGIRLRSGSAGQYPLDNEEEEDQEHSAIQFSADGGGGGGGGGQADPSDIRIVETAPGGME